MLQVGVHLVQSPPALRGLLGLLIAAAVMLLVTLGAAFIGQQLRLHIERSVYRQYNTETQRSQVLRQHARAIYEMSSMLSATLNYKEVLEAALNFGALGLRAVEFAFSSNPPSIHALMIATCGAPSASPSGGIFGSAVRMMLVRIFEEASPGSAIFPPDPPFMAALNEERSRPPLVLSGLWQFRHDCWKIGNT